MKAMSEFVKVTVADGFLFLVPLVLVVLLGREILKLTGKVLAPLVRLILAEHVAGRVGVDLLAVVPDCSSGHALAVHSAPAWSVQSWGACQDSPSSRA
jgi:hypothetical protein